MDNEALYLERFTRIKKALHCQPVDRVPVIWQATAFAPRYMGMKMSQYVMDMEASSQVALDAIDRMGGFDGSQFTGGSIAVILSGVWLSKVDLPGKELPEDSLWQIHESEVMKPEDYDTIINKGWQAFQMEYMPKVAEMGLFMQQAQWSAENTQRWGMKYKEHGIVTLNDMGPMCTIPFEYLCGGRSMSKFYMDLHRMPDKVEAAMRVIQDTNLAQIKAMPPCSPYQIGNTWIGGWRSASGLLAPKLWNRFVWPYMMEFVEVLVEKGYTPVFHWDQDWTRDLIHLNDVPAKTCCLNPDGMTDVRKFRELVGENVSLLGDVPASMFAAGTPEDIREYVRRLVEDTGKVGLLLCPGCDAPINTKPENMEAFVAAAHEFGVAAA